MNTEIANQKIENKTIYLLRKIFWGLHSYTWDEFLDTTEYASEIREIINIAAKSAAAENPLVLDIGCATGSYSIEFAKKNFSVTGIDYSPFMIRKARKKADTLNLKNAVFNITDYNEGLSFSDSYFDIVIAAHIFEGTINKNRLVAQIHKVLKSNGLLLLVTKKKRFKKNPAKKKSKSVAGYLVNIIKPYIFSGYKKLNFNIDSFIGAIEKEGFKVHSKSETIGNHVIIFRKI